MAYFPPQGSVVAFQGGTIRASVLNQTTGTSSVYAVLSSITSVSIMSANPNRRGGTVFNNAGTTVFVNLGTTVNTSVYTVAMLNQDYYELPFGWTGVVSGISASNAGRINVTELT